MSNFTTEVEAALVDWEHRVTGDPNHWEKTPERKAIDAEALAKIVALHESEAARLADYVIGAQNLNPGQQKRLVQLTKNGESNGPIL